MVRQYPDVLQYTDDVRMHPASLVDEKVTAATVRSQAPVLGPDVKM